MQPASIKNSSHLRGQERARGGLKVTNEVASSTLTALMTLLNDK